ncbi:hypothetical protein EYF80_046527 [Liparis tanakae]|uniref:Uncharacterized protein n=1 Tax=Liparis tanakae TaxID=230148 RepID=A0A4Z2FPW9_9TELE|nr:hypothetical protein EYF80_046527 [Liparis tanakae]
MLLWGNDPLPPPIPRKTQIGAALLQQKWGRYSNSGLDLQYGDVATRASPVALWTSVLKP